MLIINITNHYHYIISSPFPIINSRLGPLPWAGFIILDFMIREQDVSKCTALQGKNRTIYKKGIKLSISLAQKAVDLAATRSRITVTLPVSIVHVNHFSMHYSEAIAVA